MFLEFESYYKFWSNRDFEYKKDKRIIVNSEDICHIEEDSKNFCEISLRDCASFLVKGSFNEIKNRLVDSSWIRVKDRLPEVGVPVEVKVHQSITAPDVFENTFITQAVYENGKTCLDDWGYELNEKQWDKLTIEDENTNCICVRLGWYEITSVMAFENSVAKIGEKLPGIKGIETVVAWRPIKNN